MIKTFFPHQLSPEDLVQKARDHAQAIALERECFDYDGEIDDVRAVVNLLRHEYTTYDAQQTQQHHREACLAIAAQYPWLADECLRQISRRAQQEAHAEQADRAYEAQKAEERAKRQALVAASKLAMSTLVVGQVVQYRRGRYTYEATITKLGRSRVTLAYHLKNGQERTRMVHAALVNVQPARVPVNGEQGEHIVHT